MDTKFGIMEYLFDALRADWSGLLPGLSELLGGLAEDPLLGLPGLRL
jgi:hypothetical protein